MKITIKIVSLIIALALLTTLFVACGNTDDGSEYDGSTDGITKVCLLINGNLGDKSFFDSAAAGLAMVKANNADIITDIKELGTNSSNWESALREACISKEKYDLIIEGTDQMREKLQRVAPQFPKKRFIIFDADVNKDAVTTHSNVYSIQYKQNEGSFLAGVLAAAWLNIIDPQTVQKAGFVGGMNSDIIKDFALGYYEGIKYVNNLSTYGNTKTYVSYVGGFNDSATGKSHALSQYNSGATILFQAASQSGLGCIDAAKQLNVAEGSTIKYIIGVDSDQHEYYSTGDTNDPIKANCIITSVLKRVDLSLKQAILAFHNNSLTFGVTAKMGLDTIIDDNPVIGLAKNEYYTQTVPQSIRTLVDQVQQDIINGTITVLSAYSTSRTDFNDIEDNIKING